MLTFHSEDPLPQTKLPVVFTIGPSAFSRMDLLLSFWRACELVTGIVETDEEKCIWAGTVSWFICFHWILVFCLKSYLQPILLCLWIWKLRCYFFFFFLFQLINTLPGVDGWLGWKGRQNKGYLVEYQFLIDFNIVLCCYPDIFLIF